jgi:heme-degrading monooxygenase HmoA
MFARCTIVLGDPRKIDAAIDYVDGTVRAQVETTEGNRGFAVVADAESGRLIGASYWNNAETMLASEDRLAEARAKTAAALDGQVHTERFEVTAGFQMSIPSRGAVVRVSRFEVDPARVDEAISLTREETAPRIKGADGLSAFQQLLNRETGTGLIVTVWEDQAAAEAFRLIAEQLRARASDRVGTRFEPADTFTMIRTTVRAD